MDWDVGMLLAISKNPSLPENLKKQVNSLSQWELCVVEVLFSQIHFEGNVKAAEIVFATI